MTDPDYLAEILASTPRPARMSRADLLAAIRRLPAQQMSDQAPSLAASRRRSTSMSTSDPFDGPGSGSASLDLDALLGSLLLVTPRAVENISTSFGPKDAVRGDVAVLDGRLRGDQLADVLIFPTVLVGQLREAAGTGRMVLGRLNQGNAKPGQKPPWRLEDPSEADKTLGRAWLASNAPAPY